MLRTTIIAVVIGLLVGIFALGYANYREDRSGDNLIYHKIDEVRYDNDLMDDSEKLEYKADELGDNIGKTFEDIF